MNNCVKVVLGKEEITLKISEEVDFEDIGKCLEEKMPELKRLYQGEKTPIFVTGKVLKNEEMNKIKEIIQKEIEVKIEFDSPTSLGLHAIRKAYTEEIKASQTTFHRGGLRSGAKLEYEGSIVILGDVNAGAEVIAGENIAIIGTLRGVAHAGAKGNKKAIIEASKIEAPQLRIANIVKELETSCEEEIKTYAYVKEDKIVLE